MATLFENDEFRLLLTGHDYDFVGIIETKTEEPLTFFFSEELCEKDRGDCDWDESDIDEDKTVLLDVYEGLKEEYMDGGGCISEENDTAMMLYADSWFRTRDDRSTGFLSDCRERGQFLALVKHYCPERLKDIKWAA